MGQLDGVVTTTYRAPNSEWFVTEHDIVRVDLSATAVSPEHNPLPSANHVKQGRIELFVQAVSGINPLLQNNNHLISSIVVARMLIRDKPRARHGNSRITLRFIRATQAFEACFFAVMSHEARS